MIANAAVWSLSLGWWALAYAMLRFNAKLELQRDERLPWWLCLATAVVTASASFLLPAPWNASVALAIAGFSVASWGDWTSRILWDEITIGTSLVAAGAMLTGGLATTALQGAVLCGSLMYVFYFGALILGRETGFGDVKLAAGIGFALGPVAGLSAVAMGSLVWLGVILIWARMQRMPYKTLRVTPLPFGPGLTIGLLIGACAVPFIRSFTEW